MMAVGGAGALTGSLFGTAIATKIGTAIGTAVAPGIGTAIGAGLGLVAGGVAALIGVDIARVLTPEEDDITRSATGMEKDDYLAFAAALAENGMGNEAGTTKEEFEALFNKMGFASKGYEFDSVYSKIKSLGSEFDELANATLSV
jgi:hypothetical protein